MATPTLLRLASIRRTLRRLLCQGLLQSLDDQAQLPLLLNHAFLVFGHEGSLGIGYILQLPPLSDQIFSLGIKHFNLLALLMQLHLQLSLLLRSIMQSTL